MVELRRWLTKLEPHIDIVPGERPSLFSRPRSPCARRCWAEIGDRARTFMPPASVRASRRTASQIV